MKKELFKSKSFAVIGASKNKEKVGYIVFKNLLNKKVFPVNLKHEKILGKKCYKSVLEIKENIECAIIAIPSQFVANILEECGKKKIKNIVIISAGFSESGNLKLNEKLKKIIKKYGLNVLGPNTLGFVNPYNNVNASFFKGNLKKGEIVFLSQSGAIGVAVLDSNKKLSGFVSLGNSIDKDFSYFIDYFNKNKNTKVIAIYLESLKENSGKSFIKSCKKSKKPIVILKAGKTAKGEKAAKSHTAALASEKGVYEGIFKQIGLIEVNSIENLFRVSENIIKIKKRKIKRACIITNAGGLGVLTSDSCYKNNIEIPEIPEKTKKELSKFLPKEWSKNNPIDILGDARKKRYEKTIKILDKEKWFDFFIVLLTPQYMTQPLETAKLLLKTKKPVVSCFMGKESFKKSREILEKIPNFSDVSDMCYFLGKINF